MWRFGTDELVGRSVRAVPTRINRRRLVRHLVDSQCLVQVGCSDVRPVPQIRSRDEKYPLGVDDVLRRVRPPRGLPTPCSIFRPIVEMRRCSLCTRFFSIFWTFFPADLSLSFSFSVSLRVVLGFLFLMVNAFSSWVIDVG